MRAATDKPAAELETTARLVYQRDFAAAATDEHLRAVIEETLETPGGLTRLKLALLAGRALQLPATTAEALAVAFEYFHTASLLIDDLPCMDDATERRGALCAHRKHGEASAILGALAFINRAYALLWRALSRSCDPRHARAAAIHAERCLGDAGVLNGQALDLHFRGSDGSPRAVLHAALGKTVALLRLTLVTPALLAGASRRETLLLDRLSVYWGLGYQIADDCSDLCSRPASRKTTGRDALLGRPNFAIAAGSVATIHRLGRLLSLTGRVLEQLVALRPEWEALRPLVTHLARNHSGLETPAVAIVRQCA